jgi:hypothetical protein
MGSFPKNLWQALRRLTHRHRHPTTGGARSALSASAASGREARPLVDRSPASDRRKIVGDDRGPSSPGLD